MLKGGLEPAPTVEMFEEFRGQCPAVSQRVPPLGPPGGQSRLQFLEQRFGFDEVARVEAFGEPGVDRGEEVARVRTLALIAPQAREARRGAQLERAVALLAGDGEGAVVAGGGIVGGAAGGEEQVAVEAVEVGVEDELARLLGDGQTSRDRALRLGELAGGSLRFGQKRKEPGCTRLASCFGS